VKTEGVRGGVDDLSETDYPSIISLKSGGFAVLEDVGNGRAKVLDPAVGPSVVRMAEFADIWDSILLRAFPQGGAVEPDFNRHVKDDRLAAARDLLTLIGLPALFLLALATGLAQVGLSSTLISLALAKMIGFCLCSIMVAAALGRGGVLLSLCPLGKTINCHRVMRSAAGKVFGVSMAEWGLLYFGGGLLSLIAALFLGQVQNDVLFLGVIGLATLPYTVFSVVYQAFVVRSWCWMCLVVMGLFWVEFGVLYDIVIPRFGVEDTGLQFPLSLLLGFGGGGITWIALRHIIVAAKDTETLRMQVTRLRRQPEYIQLLLKKAEKVNVGRMPFEVEVGPLRAEHNITVVVNPLCSHCWRAFGHLDQLIRVGRGYVNGTIRFLVTPGAEETPTETEKFLDSEVSLRLLSLAQNGDRDRVQEALADWFSTGEAFSKGKYNRWRNRYSLNGSDGRERVANVLREHLNWAKSNKIFGTPTLFFNGRRLPQELQLNDLKLYLMRIIDN
jgi:uncharacterized membrane protein